MDIKKIKLYANIGIFFSQVMAAGCLVYLTFLDKLLEARPLIPILLFLLLIQNMVLMKMRQAIKSEPVSSDEKENERQCA